MAAPATSSSISSCLVSAMLPSWIRVTESRFSTIVISVSASFLMSESMEMFLGETSGLLSSTEAAPEMEVSGVRRSWETARRMLPRMVSRADSIWIAAFSAFSFSFSSYSALVLRSRRTASAACFRTRAVRKQIRQEMATMDSMATGYPA